MPDYQYGFPVFQGLGPMELIIYLEKSDGLQRLNLAIANLLNASFNSLHAGYFFMLCCLLLTSFKIIFFKNR